MPLFESEQSYISQLALVTIAIPSDGCGEIRMLDDFGQHHIASSHFENTEIPTDTKVVVIGIDDGVFLVHPFDDE